METRGFMRVGCVAALATVQLACTGIVGTSSASAPDASDGNRMDGGGLDGAAAGAFCGDSGTDATAPPAPVDTCSSLDPQGVEVLANVCPGALAVDDDWVYVSQWGPGHEGASGPGPLVRVPRCGGPSEVLTATSVYAGTLLSASSVLYRVQTDRVSKLDGSVTSFLTGCASSVGAVNADHFFTVDTCSSSLVSVPHDGTTLQTIASNISLDGLNVGRPIAATRGFAYFAQGPSVFRAPASGGTVEEVLDTRFSGSMFLSVSMIASDRAVYIRYGDGATSEVTRITDDPSEPRARMIVGSSNVFPDQGFVYLTGSDGVFRTREDLCERARMADAPITAEVVHDDRLYWCDGDKLLTRRASVSERTDCSPRPTIPQWTTLATQGAIYQGAPRIDPTGSIYAVAYESSTASVTSGLFPGLFLLKHDSTGAVQWGRWLGGVQSEALDVDSSGNVLVQIDDGRGNTELFEYATDGSLVWAVPVPSNEGASFLPNGTVVTLTHVPDVLSQLDSAGNVVSSVPLPGNGALANVTMISDKLGGLIFRGSLYGPVDWGQGPVGASGDAFLLRLDASFATTWFRDIPGALIGGAAASPGGGVVITGSATPGTDFGSGPTTDAPDSPFGFVASYDSAANLKWRRAWAGGANDVAVGSDGSVMAVGSGGGLSGLTGCWMPIATHYVFKLGPDGTFRWVEAMATDTIASGIAAASNGAPVVLGKTGQPDPTSSFLTALAP